jgi:hypothetical protein
MVTQCTETITKQGKNHLEKVGENKTYKNLEH